MVRGSNTKGMVGFAAFSMAAGAAGPPVTNVCLVDSDAGVYPRDKAINRLTDRDISRIIGRRVCVALPFASKFHRLNVRLARLRGGGSSIKSVWLPWGAIQPSFNGHGPESISAGRASVFFKAKIAGCVRGPPCCGCIMELRM